MEKRRIFNTEEPASPADLQNLYSLVSKRVLSVDPNLPQNNLYFNLSNDTYIEFRRYNSMDDSPIALDIVHNMGTPEQPAKQSETFLLNRSTSRALSIGHQASVDIQVISDVINHVRNSIL